MGAILFAESSASLTVTAAVENARAQCIKKPVACAVIANPHAETVRLAELSAKRIAPKEEAPKEAAPAPENATKTTKTTTSKTTKSTKTTK